MGSFGKQDGLTLSPRLDVGRQHGFGTPLPQESENFISTGTAFTVAGTPLDRDALLSSLGLDLHFGSGGDLSFTYDSLFSKRMESDPISAQFNWSL